MTQREPTPGPWRIIRVSKTEFQIVGGEFDAPICRIYRYDGSLADPQLVAAAPELMEAAKDAREIIADFAGEGEDVKVEALAVLVALCGAIAKAEGKE